MELVKRIEYSVQIDGTLRLLTNTSDSAINGMIRWNGTDLQGYVNNAWVSLTSSVSSISHNSLASKQGGGIDNDFYHLSTALYDNVSGLSTSTYTQLAKISNIVINTQQWEYLSALNQDTSYNSNPTFSNLNISGLNDGLLSLSGGFLTTSIAVNLETKVVGVLPIANGGTNSGTALQNGFVMISQDDKIIESAVSVSILQILDGIVSVTTGTGINNDKLVTQGYVDESIAAIPFITADNGITLGGISGETVKLGGTINEDTSLISLNKTINFGNPVNHFNAFNIYANDYWMHANNTFTISSGSLTFPGLVYTSNFSPNFVNRSLPDVEWVNNRISTSISTLLLPVANGGTNSNTALVNNRVMVSSFGKIIESSSISTTNLSVLSGITSVVTGTSDNNKFATKGYIDNLVAANAPVWGSITGLIESQTDLINYFSDRFEVKGQLDSLHNLGLYQGNIEELGMHWTEADATFDDIQAIYHTKHLEQGIVIAGSYGGPNGTGLRVYRSTDYGKTFPTIIQLPTPNNNNGTTFHIVYLQNGIVLIGGYESASNTNGFTYRSTDYGLTWTRVSMSTDVKGVFCYCDLEGGNILAGCINTNQLFKSTDYGATWAVLTSIGSSTGSTISTLTYLGSNTTQQIVIAGLGDHHVYKSLDGGATWTDLFTATSAVNCSSYFGNGVIVIGTEDGTLYRSNDYGVNWVTFGGNTSIRFITYVGSGVAFYTTSGPAKLFKTVNNGSSWFEVSNAFSGFQYSLKLSYAGNGLMFAAVGDSSGGNAKVYRSTIFEPIVKPIIKGIIYEPPVTNAAGYLHNDGTGILTWGSIDLSTLLAKSNNLSDLADSQTALNNITSVASANNEYVLTKDTATGNAKWKSVVAIGGPNYGKTYYVSDTETNDVWVTGKVSWKTIGGFLTEFDANANINHTHVFTGTLTNNSNVITGISDTSAFNIGDIVLNALLPYNTKVISKTLNSITLNNNATGSNSSLCTLLNSINVVVNGSHTTTAHINRRNLTYFGNANIVHTSSEYLIEHDDTNLLQPETILNSDFTITSTNSGGLYRNLSTIANLRTSETGINDYIIKFKSYIGLTSTKHFLLTDSTYTNNLHYNKYSRYYIEYKDVNVTGDFMWGYYCLNVNMVIRMSLTSCTGNAFYNQEFYSPLYDILGGEIIVPKSNYAIYTNTHYNYVNFHRINCTITGCLNFNNSGGVFDIYVKSANSACFGSYDNTLKGITVNGSVDADSVSVGGCVVWNAKVGTMYIVGGNAWGSPIITGTFSSIIINSDSGHPVFIRSTHYAVYGSISLSANREVIFDGYLYNSGYNSCLSVSAGIFRNRGIIQDGYYGIQVNGTGKFVNESIGKIYYNRIGINQNGGTIVQNGRLEHQNGGYAEICGINKASGTLYIGQGASFKVDNGNNPILCQFNNSNSQNVIFKTGISTNADLLTAYPGYYAPLPVASGYSYQVDVNILE